MMRFGILGGVLLAGSFAVSGNFAQAQSMDQGKRACAATCLAKSPGATSPEYNLCLQVQCDVYYETPQAQKAPASRAGWGAGVTADGQAHYAGLSDESLTKSIYYLCDAAGASSLSLVGGAIAPGLVYFSIDRESYQLDFQAKDGALYAYAPIDSAVMQAVLIGSRLEIFSFARELVGAFSLRGAAVAIKKARQGCD